MSQNIMRFTWVMNDFGMAFVLATPSWFNMSEEVETKKNSLAHTVFSCVTCDAARRRDAC